MFSDWKIKSNIIAPQFISEKSEVPRKFDEFIRFRQQAAGLELVSKDFAI